MRENAGRAVVIGAGLFLLAASSFPSERPLLSDKSAPFENKLEIIFPENRPPFEFQFEPEEEEPFPVESLADQPDLLKTLKLERINHPRVQYYFDYFTGKERDRFQIWLNRTALYQDFIQAKLKERGLPENLFYLAMIESGLNPYALSRAGAGGVWQFMPSTARKFGLRVDFWVDERRDLEKSTEAAISYLTELYTRFDSWPLALASYNAGEGRVQRAVQRYDTEDYWELIEYRLLKRETRDYLPKMIAASILAENPEKYGFTKPETEPITQAYDIVVVNDAVDLSKAALYCDTTVEEMRRLNPSIRRDISPPDSNYEIKLPLGTKEQFASALDKLTPEDILSYYRHRVRRGETLSTICRKYGTSIAETQRVNHIKSSAKIRAGQVLIMPVYVQFKPRQTAQAKADAKKSGQTEAKVTIRYKVVKGDTLYDIALAANVWVKDIKAWNQIGSNISAGQELVLYLTPVQAGKFQSWAKKTKRVAMLDSGKETSSRI